MDHAIKIIGVGLNKTGTTTLGVCLKHWGFKHVSCKREAFDLWRQGRTQELHQWIHRYDSFEDWPWPLLYKEIDEWFPGSKFILTRRITAQTWFRSLYTHSIGTGPSKFRKHIYGHEMPHDHANHHITCYNRHLEAVREYFQGRPDDFLEVCWEKGDGWAELSAFLGMEKPDIPFPHANKAPV